MVALNIIPTNVARPCSCQGVRRCTSFNSNIDRLVFRLWVTFINGVVVAVLVITVCDGNECGRGRGDLVYPMALLRVLRGIMS